MAGASECSLFGIHPASLHGGQPETAGPPRGRGTAGSKGETPVRRATLSLTVLVLIVAAASRAGAGGFDARIGAFFPRGNETLFQDDRDLYLKDGAPLQKSDFYGVYGGV